MAYQASASRSTVLDTVQHLTQRIGQALRAVANAVMESSEGNRRLMYAQTLQAKSDAELAALHIKREDIIEHAFGRSF